MTEHLHDIGPEVVEQAMRYLRSRVREPGVMMRSPNAVRQLVELHYARARHEREVFSVLLLDNRHRVIALVELFFGTIDTATVHAREVVKAALKRNAAAVIFAHNHPSGVAEPSRADELLTRRLKEALALIDVRVLDHIVVGDGESVSMAERGLL